MAKTLRPILIMGVSGAGKSTLARAVADALGGSFLEGDDYHSAENRAKMTAGMRLSDEDRWPWLASIGHAAAQVRREGQIAVVACSALKRAYRDVLRETLGDVGLIHLDGDPVLIGRRMAERAHFMPPSLLGSQLADLELPENDEGALRLDPARPVAESVAAVVAWHADLAGGPAAP